MREGPQRWLQAAKIQLRSGAWQSNLGQTKTRRKRHAADGQAPHRPLFCALQNWVRLQNDPEYDCFYFIADWHALTSDYADTSAVAQNTIENRHGLFGRRSRSEKVRHLPAIADSRTRRITLAAFMVTPLSWLERVPTYKEPLKT